MSPQAAFRSWVGVAKDTVNGNILTGIAASATSITLTNIVGTPTTSMSAIIVDGVNTETVAVSGWATPTLTVGATTYAHSANVYVYLQLAASIGPTAYIPIETPDWSDVYVQLYDKAFRGSQASVYGAQQGMRNADLSLAGPIFPDSFGYILSSFFGAYDYTATAGGNPTTYAFSPLNTSNGQPPPYLVYIYNPANSNTRVFAKAVCSDLTIKLDPGALATYTSTWKSFASGVVANPGTIPPTFSSFTALPSRVGGTTIGGTVTGKLESAEYSFKREEFAPIFTLQGVQDPLALFSGPVACTAKTVIIPDDDVQFLNYINQSQPAMVVTATIGATTAANGIKIQTTKSNYETVKVVQTGKAYVTLDVPFTAIANSTDKSTAGGGLSPALVTLSTGTVGTATLY
jgi:hypothetical protein